MRIADPQLLEQHTHKANKLVFVSWDIRFWSSVAAPTGSRSLDSPIVGTRETLADLLDTMMGSSSVSASDWVNGIALSIAASVIGGASKLAIRKSWLIEHDNENEQQRELQQDALTRISDEEEQQQEQVEYRMDTTRRRTNHWPVCLRLSGMFGMTFLNPLCGVLAMNYASPSILAPFSGLTLVWIVLFSYQLIGERPSKRQVIAAAMIVFGEVIVAVFGDHTNDVGVNVHEVVRAFVLRVEL